MEGDPLTYLTNFGTDAPFAVVVQVLLVSVIYSRGPSFIDMFLLDKVYDHSLTLSEEVSLIWKRKLNFLSLTFFINRYLPYLDIIISSLGEHCEEVRLGTNN